jgi:2-haloalkanoic acid dehalogenase type II
MQDITTATFDCYGTLVDWEGGLGTFLYDLARRHGDHDPGPGRALRERWEEIQFEVVQSGYKRYRDVLHESLCEWVAERGYRWNQLEGEALERAMEGWQPFPDTVPALRRAKDAGLRLVIVSNTDRDILEHTLRQLEIEFDHLVTAQDCQAYKPDGRVFARARDEIGDDPEQVLHVAFGFKYDIAPAQRTGFRTAWVNRKGEAQPGAERPDFEWRDLWGLAELAEGSAG